VNGIQAIKLVPIMTGTVIILRLNGKAQRCLLFVIVVVILDIISNYARPKERSRLKYHNGK